MSLTFLHVHHSRNKFFLSWENTTVVIRYNTIGGVHKYESCYKPIVLYEMARFYLVPLDTIWLEIHGMR